MTKFPIMPTSGVITIIILTACGGGSGGSDTGTTNGGIASNISFETLLDDGFVQIFSNSDDNRIFRTKLDDGTTATLIGEKTSSGTIISANRALLQNDQEATIDWEYSPTTNTVTTVGNGYQTDITPDGLGNYILKLTIGEESATVSIGTDSSMAVANPRSITNNKLEITSRAQEFVRTFDVQVIGECSHRVEKVNVKAFNDSGNPLDFIVGFGNSENGFNIPVPVFDFEHDLFVDASRETIEFLEEHASLPAIGDFVSGTIAEDINRYTVDFASEDFAEAASLLEMELQNGSSKPFITDSARYNRIVNLQQTLVDQNVLGILSRSAKRAFGGLDIINRAIFVAETARLAGKFIDAYAEQLFREVQFRPIAVTDTGQQITGQFSGTVSPNGPFPDLVIDAGDEVNGVPCNAGIFTSDGGTFAGFFNPGKGIDTRFDPPIPACLGGPATVTISNVILTLDNISFTSAERYKEDYCLYDWTGDGIARSASLSYNTVADIYIGSTPGGFVWNVRISEDGKTANTTFSYSHDNGVSTGRYSGSFELSQ